MKQYHLAFDVNGNDNGVKAAVKAAIYFLQKNKNFKITLVGDEQEIKKYLPEEQISQIMILNNPNTVKSDENIKAAIKVDSSMKSAITMVKNKEADAVLSSGDSASYLALCNFVLKRLDNVSRPAFMPIFPTIKGKKFLLLDVGANLEVKKEFLKEWALISNEYAKIILNIDQPKIALVNIGTEEYKGNEVTKEANLEFKELPNINYIGFVEPRDLLRYICDVAIIDGYGGNILLKSIEGAILSFKDIIKEKISAKLIRKIGYLFIKGAFRDVSETLDYRNVGSAYVIGVNGLAMKAHGSSDYLSFLGALNQIKLALEKDIMTKVNEASNEIN
ncbi:phosphate acyltransferase PlsX [Mycoplasmopsis ciconiae]|uniref:Phosphate acyltransferase n=1 Tax=Mycoplasmopsis ciconiae TaxID=561067 RepID=A0ABU7MLN2_9BACT|nr:phosphate acyltransferase PlsX [Mycoplasmopsis ciconiae]